MTTETGGPAFPTQTYDHGAAINGISCTVTDDPGMTLRDYFAAKAIPQLMASHGERLAWEHKHIASEAYCLADAMIEARTK
jgi:hypothetical protein